MEVGCVRYLNALPLTLASDTQKIPSNLIYRFDTPSALNKKLIGRELKIALTSCVQAFQPGFDFLPGYGISATHRIMSVNLYHQLPLQKIRSIAVTEQTATSLLLLRVLCHFYWKIKPEFHLLDRSRPFETNEALLLIGDEALQTPSLPQFLTVDLAATWHAWVGLPFVFALLALNCDVTEKMRQSLKEELERALNWSRAYPEEFTKEAMKRSGLPRQVIVDYFACCCYRLSHEEINSLSLFKHYVSKISS